MSEQIDQIGTTPADEYQRWTLELQLAAKQTNDWFDRARKIVRRYRDERDAVAKDYYRFNILWSNVQTLFPAIYAKCPKADVSRRFNLADPVGRVAALILERALNFEIEHYSDFDGAMRAAVEDALLPGCGTAWVRYEPKTAPMEAEAADTSGEQQTTLTDDVQIPERIIAERSPVDYVYWEDFLMSPARTWEEVRWVGRRVYLSRDEGIERFGKEFEQVPMDHKPADLKDNDKVVKVQETFKKAEIYEIWDKPSGKVIWISKSYKKLLDEKSDPLELEGFFPCPKPLLATTTTGSLVPVPDYVEYQDQARELDLISDRIHMLDKAIKVVGVYNAAATGVQRMLNEGVDNQLIPVDNWAMFAEQGGIEGQTDWLPIEQIVGARQILAQERDALIQQIYQLTGISDILRGQTDPDETLGAQQIKASAGALRLKRRQKEVAAFASCLIRLKTQIICKFYQPQTLVALCGITQQDPDFALIEPALMLMKSEPLNTFRIEANADSMVELDQMQERQERIEFLKAVGEFVGQAVQGAQTMPEAMPLLGKMLMFAVRGFKIGREMEGDLEQMLSNIQPPQQKPDPAMAKAQADVQLEQARQQHDQQMEMMRQQFEREKFGFEQQLEQFRAEKDAEVEAARQHYQAMESAQQNELEAQRANLEAHNQAVLEQMRIASDRQMEELRQQFTLLINSQNNATKVEVAEIGAQTTLQASQISAAKQAEAE